MAHTHNGNDNNSGNMVAIVAIIAVIVIVALGFYFFFMKPHDTTTVVPAAQPTPTTINKIEVPKSTEPTKTPADQSTTKGSSD